MKEQQHGTDLDRNRNSVRRVLFEQGFGQGDLSVIDECAAPTAVDHHGLGKDVPGMHEHLAGVITMLRAAMPDLTATVEHLVAEGDLVAAHVILRGTHTGAPIMGVPAGGRPFEVEQFHIVRCDEHGRGGDHWAAIGDIAGQLAGSPVTVP